MVILATTRQGFESLRALLDTGAHPVWVGASVLTAGESLVKRVVLARL